MTEPLAKVDSAVEGVTSEVKETKKPRQSTVAAAGVFKIEDLGKCSSPLQAWAIPQLSSRRF